MARIPEHKIDEVRLAANIAEVVGRRVKLTPAGKNLKGLCPFHGDTDPSFVVNRERGTWHCFGCGEGGNVFTFLMKDENLSFPEAVKELAGRYGVRLPQPKLTPAQKRQDEHRRRLLRVMELAGNFYSQQLAAPAGGAARRYLREERGLGPQVVEEFGLGWAPDSWEGLRRHLGSKGVPEELATQSGMLVPRDKGDGTYDRFRGRVMFPITNAGGRIVSFGGRILGPGEPKYLNGPETGLFNKSATLYNLQRARRHMRKKDRALVVEGYFDVITLAAMGMGETVAPMGTALTSRQVRRLKGQAKDLVLFFDGDAAGRRAARRSLPICLAEGVSPSVLLLPEGSDPDSFARENGAAGLEEALGGARPLVEAVLEMVIAEGDESTPEGKSRIVAECGGVIKDIKDPVVASEYLKHLARRLGLSLEVVARRLGLPVSGGGAAARSPRPAAPRREESSDSQSQSLVLEVALAHPGAAQVLYEEGALDLFEDPILVQIASAIKEAIDTVGRAEPGNIINFIDDNDLRSFVIRLAEKAPPLPAGEEVARARDKARSLHVWQIEKRINALSSQIADLALTGDDEGVTKLQAEKSELRKQRQSLRNLGKD